MEDTAKQIADIQREIRALKSAQDTADISRRAQTTVTEDFQIGDVKYLRVTFSTDMPASATLIFSRANMYRAPGVLSWLRASSGYEWFLRCEYGSGPVNHSTMELTVAVLSDFFGTLEVEWI